MWSGSVWEADAWVVCVHDRKLQFLEKKIAPIPKAFRDFKLKLKLKLIRSSRAAPRETPLEPLPPLPFAPPAVSTPSEVSPVLGTFGVASQIAHFYLQFALDQRLLTSPHAIELSGRPHQAWPRSSPALRTAVFPPLPCLVP